MLNRDLLYKTAENMGVKIDDDAFNVLIFTPNCFLKPTKNSI